MTAKRTHIASIKGDTKKVTVRGVLVDWDWTSKYDAGMFNEPEYGYIFSDETGSIKIAPFHGTVGTEYEITGEVVGSGEYATIYNPEIVSRNEKPNLNSYQAKFEVHNPDGESPFAGMIAKEKARKEDEEKTRKMLIVGGIIVAGILFWWFFLHNGGNATAICNDGTTSYSRHHSGTCSDHGGVQQWLDTSTDTTDISN